MVRTRSVVFDVVNSDATSIRSAVNGNSNALLLRLSADTVRIDEFAAVGDCEGFAYDVAFGSEETREDAVVVVVDLGVIHLYLAGARIERAVRAYVDGMVVDGVFA